MGEIELEVLMRHAGWKGMRGLKANLTRASDALYLRLPKSLQKPLEVTVLLTSNAEVKQLNHTFRGIPKATNVLSFPAEKTGKSKGRPSIEESGPAGDIVLAYQYIVAEAQHDHKGLIPHTCHLLVHGILHILGYDHGTGAEARRMEGLETRILLDLGFPDPYVQELEE